jgi:hypothetical protein
VPSAPDDLPWRQQLLDRPYGEGLTALIEHIAGLNAQTALGPLVGIYARTGPCTTATLDDLRSDYQVVKINVMRGTVHMLTARQYWAWRPALATLLKRNVARYCRGIWDRVDSEELLRWGTDFVSDGRHMTRGDLGTAASQRFPEGRSDELGFALRMILPLVEVPPKSAWQQVRTRYVYAPSVMTGTPSAPDDGLQDLARSFATAFNSDSAADFRYWSGLTKSESTTLGDGLVDIPRGGATRTTTVLPEFDNIYFCRSTSTAPLYDAKKDPRLPPARMPGTLVAQGRVVAHWTARKGPGLRLEPWTALEPAAIDTWQRFNDWYALADN